MVKKGIRYYVSQVKAARREHDWERVDLMMDRAWEELSSRDWNRLCDVLGIMDGKYRRRKRRHKSRRV